ncbi:hypothetical protein NHX12_024689 [Muraenolepis orangiensis]|uniref:Fibronectin type-III domain-containing protein n=1 Tax=Muraenolepis orangiensis TaxID=630683 RepID=A0A9Q0ELF9_9TELE|nr:hypothetical protein NHX12_024689 [Muraenolepis orangiensis]
MLWSVAWLLMSAKLTSPVHHPPSTESNHNLICENDYLFTIRCSLTIDETTDEQPDTSKYRLELEDDVMVLDEVVHRCELKEAAGGGGRRVCSIDRRDKHNDSMTFMMGDKVKVSLCLNEDGKPSVVALNAGQFLFSWNSSYEEYLPHVYLCDYLTYHLEMDREGHTTDNGSSRLLVLELEEPRFTAEVEEFTPDAEYTVRVRTVGLDKGLITIIILCVLAPVLVLLGSIPIMKLKKRRFIPTPVLHYTPLSNHYQGVIKSWVVASSVDTDPIKTENIARIDVLAESVDVPAEEDSGKARHHSGVPPEPARHVPPPDRTHGYAVTPGPDAKRPLGGTRERRRRGGGLRLLPLQRGLPGRLRRRGGPLPVVQERVLHLVRHAVRPVPRELRPRRGGTPLRRREPRRLQKGGRGLPERRSAAERHRLRICDKPIYPL